MICLKPDWPLPDKVQALVTTREGGVSQAPYTSFNTAMHVGDDRQAVEANRQKLLRHVVYPIQWLEQVHGTQCLEILQAEDKTMVADAAYTRAEGVVCVVQTADCLPILIAHKEAKFVAAVHAGWRGLAAGIISRTLKILDVDSSNLSIFIGPAISFDYFEVGEEVLQAFESWARALSLTPDNLAENFIESSSGPKKEKKYRANLAGLAKTELKALGVESIYGGNLCTWRDNDRFYSYRKEGVTGRFTSAIWLTPEDK